MMTAREMVVALITEQLHLWELDRTDPIPDPYGSQEDAQRWLARRQPLDGLLRDNEDEEEIIGLLVNFAARSVSASVKARQEHNVRLGRPPGEGDALSFMQTVAIGYLAEEEEDE
jgi:hypothetical protein